MVVSKLFMTHKCGTGAVAVSRSTALETVALGWIIEVLS